MGSPASRQDVPPEVREWLAANLLRGAPRGELARVMAKRGVPQATVEMAIAEIAEHPAFRAASSYANAVRRTLALEALEREHRAAFTPHEQPIARLRAPDAEGFLREHIATLRPAVITGLMDAWPARGKWTPEWLAATYGEVPVKVTLDREADPLYQPNEDAHMAEMPLGRFVEMVRGAGETNDFYMVGRTHTLHRPELRALLADLEPVPAFVEPGLYEGSHLLWFGPAGTVTPLHHDPHNLLFCQVYGRKRFHMVKPRDVAMNLYASAFYSPIDAERPDLGRYPEFAASEVHTFDVGPGEAVYIPVGWWHQVRSLDVSISVTLGGVPYPTL